MFSYIYTFRLKHFLLILVTTATTTACVYLSREIQTKEKHRGGGGIIQG